MSRREDIDNAIWSDPDFEALSLPATCLYLWSFTNPRCGMAGLYKVSARAMTESKVDRDALDEALEELAAARFLYYEDGVLFVRARVKHMRQRTEQIAKSIRTDLTKVAADHPMRGLWVQENARAPWLVKFLGVDWDLHAVPDGESLATVGGPSGEARWKGSLEPIPGGSSKGRSTLQGNGNGSGTGKGQGQKKFARARGEFPEFPDVDPNLVRLVIKQLREDGRKPTVDAIRERLEVPDAA